MGQIRGHLSGFSGGILIFELDTLLFDVWELFPFTYTPTIIYKLITNTKYDLKSLPYYKEIADLMENFDVNALKTLKGTLDYRNSHRLTCK